MEVIGSSLFALPETFSLVLSNPTNADASPTPGIGTIDTNNPPPAVSVAGATASEGQNLNFVVSLSSPSEATTTVAYATANSTSGNMATAGADYTPVSGTLTFAPGVTTQTIAVAALNDLLLEPTETFQMVLSNPVNATLGGASATGSILDVPPAPVLGLPSM